MKKIAFVTEIVSPYRVPFLNALNNLLKSEKSVLNVFFLRESESRRDWAVEKERLACPYKIAKSILFQRPDQEPHYLNFGLKRQISDLDPDILILGGFAQPAYWSLLFWAKKNKKNIILFCESFQKADSISYFLFKSFFVKKCNKFVVPGRFSKEYLIKLGAKEEDIFIAPDAVENNYYTSANLKWNDKKSELKKEKGFPDRIILYAGRINKIKGIYDLLDVFKKVNLIFKNTGLVIVGSSVQEGSFRAYCKKQNIENVFFEGYKQKEELVKYYAMADIFVLPAYYDPWGMVINEAMLSKLAVVSSTSSQAAIELIKDGENGFLYKAGDIQELYKKIDVLLQDEKLKVNFAKNAFDSINKTTPELMAEGFLKAIHNCI